MWSDYEIFQDQVTHIFPLLRCKIFSLKIWVCKIFDKFHVWLHPADSGRSIPLTSTQPANNPFDQKQRTRRPICKDDRPSIVVGRVEIERGVGSQTSGWRHLVSDDYSLISYGRLYWELDSHSSFCILCPSGTYPFYISCPWMSLHHFFFLVIAFIS